MAEINFKDLPGCADFVGKPIKEHGVDIELPLSRFEIKGDMINIHAMNGESEECIGNLNITHCNAAIEADGNLYMYGSNCPTFVLYMS